MQQSPRLWFRRSRYLTHQQHRARNTKPLGSMRWLVHLKRVKCKASLVGPWWQRRRCGAAARARPARGLVYVGRLPHLERLPQPGSALFEHTGRNIQNILQQYALPKPKSSGPSTPPKGEKGMTESFGGKLPQHHPSRHRQKAQETSVAESNTAGRARTGGGGGGMCGGLERLEAVPGVAAKSSLLIGQLAHALQHLRRDLRRLAPLIEHGEHGDAQQVAPLVLEVHRRPAHQRRRHAARLQRLHIQHHHTSPEARWEDTGDGRRQACWSDRLLMRSSPRPDVQHLRMVSDMPWMPIFKQGPVQSVRAGRCASLPMCAP